MLSDVDGGTEWTGACIDQLHGRQYVFIPATGVQHLGTTRGDAWVAFALPERH